MTWRVSFRLSDFRPAAAKCFTVEPSTRSSWYWCGSLKCQERIRSLEWINSSTILYEVYCKHRGRGLFNFKISINFNSFEWYQIRTVRRAGTAKSYEKDQTEGARIWIYSLKSKKKKEEPVTLQMKWLIELIQSQLDEWKGCVGSVYTVGTVMLSWIKYWIKRNQTERNDYYMSQWIKIPNWIAKDPENPSSIFICSFFFWFYLV